jgi:hypothetical protein
MGDEYNRRARLRPALLAALPISTAAVVLGITKAEWWSSVAGLVVASGFWGLVSQIGRHLGKKREAELWNSWGGAPTTILLRHRDNPNPVRVVELHKRLSAITGMTFPTPEQEAEDPQTADNIYETATDQLRRATRAKEQFPLVFEENCNYGFRRNVLGLRSWAIGICLAAAIALGALFIPDNDVVKSARGVLVALAVLDLVGAVAWWRLINADWVKQPAFAYAQRLLEETWALGSGADGPSRPTVHD